MSLNPAQFPQYRVIKNEKTPDEKQRDAIHGSFKDSVIYHYEAGSDRRKDGESW
jgi:hypothetical protein